ncbi:uncharacterized protein M2323_003471 [Rhodoblastus acidophilus]|uniref:Mth938-like domain-containing protein n=1 Tax=Rhodoblastus acidophilus TaxID=1074 RepID=UPI0029CABBA6|nr:Mth938-like domain-containing protein [Rhodoblastus acidophilus]MCW2285554.1 uncharacterized protein [Rhodoblastus acidophilus]MCW2334530.1 uncharacterized protein [Rhodoblastus acidophilus]
MIPERKYEGFLPGAHMIEGIGQGAFEFGGMSHVGSLLLLPDGVRAISVTRFAEVDEGVLAPLFALPRGNVELLLFGCGPSLQPVPPGLRQRLLEAGVRCDPMSTGHAAQTYNILLGEKRRVGALLIAVA